MSLGYPLARLPAGVTACMISAPSILLVKYHLNLRARDTQKVHEQAPFPFREGGCIFIQPEGGVSP
jgi:hypothetical protein